MKENIYYYYIRKLYQDIKKNFLSKIFIFFERELNTKYEIITINNKQKSLIKLFYKIKKWITEYITNIKKI